jgi:hypothetical protein
VELTWTIRGEAKSLALVTNLIPRGIETVAGGGTLTINVFDADALPVAAAEVRVVNTTTSPNIDVTVYTNAAGIAMFPGAPASGGYQVSATKTGYSLDQTYSASAANPNPNPPHVSVVEGEVSTVYFAIDRTSALAIRTVAPPSTEADIDTFADQSAIAVISDAMVSGDTLALATTSTGYVAAGSARSTAIAPAYLLAWGEASWSAAVPSGTSIGAQIYAVDGSGTATLVPDADLPGNAAGFATSPIDIGPLDVELYPRLALGFALASPGGLETPAIAEREVSFVVADTPIPNIDFTLAGTKNIGTDGSGVPIKKYEEIHQTNGSGINALTDLEWDLYTLALDSGAGYDIAGACPESPFSLEPGTQATSTYVLVPTSAHSLLIRVETSLGEALEGASVRLTRSGFDETLPSSACGYTHFDDLTPASDYAIEVTAPGYSAYSESDMSISGTETQTVVLTES